MSWDTPDTLDNVRDWIETHLPADSHAQASAVRYLQNWEEEGPDVEDTEPGDGTLRERIEDCITYCEVLAETEGEKEECYSIITAEVSLWPR